MATRGSDDTRLQAGLFGEYNFDMGTYFVPYVGLGADLGWWDSDMGDDSYVAFSAWGGGKYFLVEDLAIACQLQLWAASEVVYLGDGRVENTDWALVLSTRYLF